MPFGADNTVMIIAVAASAVVVWVFCAFSTAVVARSNGQSYNGWLTAGFLGGPFALLIAYLYFRYAGDRRRMERYSDGTRYHFPEIVQCPRCDQSVPASFENCQFCGEPLHKKRKR